MKKTISFSHRPFSLSKKLPGICLAAFLLMTTAVHAQESRSGVIMTGSNASNSVPVRYGQGGFAPTDLSGSGNSDDMTSGDVTSAPLPDSPPPSSGSSGSGAGSSSYQGNTEVRLTTLEEQMRDLRGQMEEKDHQITVLQTRLDKALADMDQRLNQGGGSNAGAATGGGNLKPDDMGGSSMPPQPNSNPNGPAPSDSPTQQKLGSLKEAPNGAPIAGSGDDAAAQYEAAFTQLKNGDYETAQTSFNSFLKAHPTHQLAANATYWYGETYYAQQKFSDAARIFAESYKKYPQGPKAPDSLLKLGMSLGGAGKNAQGCVALKQLKKQYPTGNSNVLHRADQEMSKLSCS